MFARRSSLVARRSSLVARRSSLVALACLSLTLSGLPVVLFHTVAAAPARAAAPVEDNSSRPDTVSAMVTARSVGERVEDLSQRDPFTRVFANPDGTWTAESSTYPEAAQDPATGEWEPIDTTLVAEDGGFRAANALSDVLLSDGGDKVFAQLTEQGKDLDWKWTGTLPKPVIEGPTATYPNVVSNGDLEVTATASGFTYNIVLRAAPTTPLVLKMPIATDGAVITETAQGGFEVETKAGEVLAEAPPPVMWDSSVNTIGDPDVAPVDASVGKTSTGTPTITLAPDQGFLTDPNTVYPVTVDPTFTAYATGDKWVQNQDYTNVGEELRVGTYDGGTHKARAFMNFNTATWNGKKIVSAILTLRNFHSTSCTSSGIRAVRLTSAWTAATLTWANQPTATSTGQVDYAPAAGGPAGSNCELSADATWPVTSIVQTWADTPSTNYGIRLNAVTETSNASWRKYRSRNQTTGGVGLNPKIEVTYAYYPTSTKPVVTTTPASSVGYSISTAPTFSATLNDTDGGNLRAYFDVFQGTTLKWHSNWSNTVSNGGKATVTMPTGVLANGVAYTVKVRGNDMTNTGPYSTATAFTVDTTAPTATVTASGFTNGQWKLQAPASNTFTLTGSADTAAYLVTKDGGTATSMSVGGAAGTSTTVDWNVEAGWHTLSVTGIDKAGNAGIPTTFGFGVDVPTFVAPTDGTGSATGLFTLQPQGKASATSATVKWRLNDTTTWNTATGLKKTDGSAWTGTTADSGEFSTPGVLRWNATDETDPAAGQKLAGPLLLELQTCFNIPALPDPHCSTPLLVQLDDGFGGNYPTTELGPTSVSLITGQMNMDSTDAATGAAALGRVWSTANARTSTDGPFGRGWDTTALTTGNTSAGIIDNRDRDGSFVVWYATGGDEKFTRKGTTDTWVPVDTTNTSTKLVLSTTGGAGGTSALTLTQGTDTSTPVVTTWNYDTTQDEWVPKTADGGGAAPDATVVSTGTKVTWISQVPDDSTATCTATTNQPDVAGSRSPTTGPGMSPPSPRKQTPRPLWLRRTPI